MIFTQRYSQCGFPQIVHTMKHDDERGKGVVLPSRKPYPPAGDLWISDTRAVDSSVALEREVVTAEGLPFLVVGLSAQRAWALV